MDYMHEELTRQRNLWSALLLGPSQREKAEESGQPDGRAGQESSSPRRHAPEKQEPLPGESLVSALASRSKRVRQAAATALGLPAGEMAEGLGTGELASSALGLGTGEAATAPGAPDTKISQELWAMLGGEAANPQALSRAFQRDARRYDGGFTLY